MLYIKRMIILSNDYRSSLPGSNVNIKGGPARFAADFSAFAVSRGHRWIGLLHSHQGSNEKWQKLAETENKEFYSIAARTATATGLRLLSGGNDPESYFNDEIEVVRKLVHAINPDIFFLNGFSVYAWLLFKAVQRNKTPIVIQHAGIWTKEIDMYPDMFAPAARDFCVSMERDAAECADANIFLNQFSYHMFEQIVVPRTIAAPSIIPLPSPGRPLPATFAPAPKNERIIGMVARWDRIKNHSSVLALAEAIRSAGLPWKIRVVTTIPDTPLMLDFKTRYRELIDVVPVMDRESLQVFYRSVDILILPSHFDTVGGVVMEAIAEGKPTLISPHVGWINEYEKCGMEKWIVDFENPEIVIDSLKMHLARPAWPELEIFAKYIEKWHNRDVVYEAYMTLFAKLAH